MNTQLSHAEDQARSSLEELSPLPHPTGRQNIIVILSVCMALQMTSFVIILPLFARRFSELGAGVESLGISSMAYAIAATLAAPFMGALADRFGRRRLVLGSLAIYVLAFIGYRFASSTLAFVLLRGLAGAFTAGLIPAVTSIVADLAPIDRRAQSIGIVNGGASIGWIAGPLLGGVLYDYWGYSLAISVSIFMAGITFILAYIAVPETRVYFQSSPLDTDKARRDSFKASVQAFQQTLPHSLSSFLVLLFVAFAVMFAWAFIEPKFMFYTYDDLGWSSSMLGLVMSTYGVAMTFGEFSLSRLSDHIGRKPVILLGMLLFMAQFAGLAFFHNYALIAISFVIAGLGNALFDPALSASILDIAPMEHQARILGFKSTASSLGNIAGPALVVLFTPFLDARSIFITAIGIVCISILFFLSIRTKSNPVDSKPQKNVGETFLTGKSAE